MLGLVLVLQGGWFAAGWLQAKLVLVLAMSVHARHVGRWVRDFRPDRNHHTQKFYRIVNEVPTF